MTRNKASYLLINQGLTQHRQAKGQTIIDCRDPAISAEQYVDLQWLVEFGNRWSNEPAAAHRATCLAVADNINERMVDALAPSDGASSRRDIDLRDARISVAVDERSDLAPWELLNLGQGPAGLVGKSVVRVPQTNADLSGSTATSGPLRVLLVTARPFSTRDVPYLAVAQHLRELLQTHKGRLELRVLRPPTFEAFSLALAAEAGRVDVIHFDGHGDLRQEGPILVFEASGGGPLNIPADVFIKPVRDADPKLIVMNACRSAQAPTQEANEPQPAEIDPSLAYRIAARTGLPVVAMRYLVEAEVAGRFVGALYGELLATRTIGEAVQAARRQLATTETASTTPSLSEGSDWLLPVLYLPGEDAAILTSPSPYQPKTETYHATLHGLDDAFLSLEKAADTNALPVLWGPIGVDKFPLALAFAEWKSLTRDSPPGAYKETAVHVPDLLAGNRTANEGRETATGRILRLVPTPGASPLVGSSELDVVLAMLAGQNNHDIVLLDGDFGASPPRVEGVAWVEIPSTNPDAIAAYLRQTDPEISTDVLRSYVREAAGNPAFARALAGADAMNTHPMFGQAREILRAAEIRTTTRAVLAYFRLILNIFTLRQILYDLNVLDGEVIDFLDPKRDQESIERKECDELRRRGLLTPLTANTFFISPWLSAALNDEMPNLDDESESDAALSFARAQAGTCSEYNTDYFLRGNRLAANIITMEEENISRAWDILAGVGEFDRQVSLYSARAAKWTLEGNFDLIDNEAEALEARLETDKARDQLLMLRLHAANVTGRLTELVDAVEATTDRAVQAWRSAGEPRGLATDGMPSAYVNMLIAKQNLLGTLRSVGRTEEHRRLCRELLEEYALAEYGNGTVKVIQSMAHSLPPDPVPSEAAEVRDLFLRHFDVIEKGDRILQSEVLAKVAMLNPDINSSRDAERQAALSQSAEWLHAALRLLPPRKGANHAGIHRDLSQICARLGHFDEMDSHALEAIEGFEALGYWGDAAIVAAMAADAWSWAGRGEKCRSYADAARGYLNRAEPSENAQITERLLMSLS